MVLCLKERLQQGITSSFLRAKKRVLSVKGIKLWVFMTNQMLIHLIQWFVCTMLILLIRNIKKAFFRASIQQHLATEWIKNQHMKLMELLLILSILRASLISFKMRLQIMELFLSTMNLDMPLALKELFLRKIGILSKIQVISFQAWLNGKVDNSEKFLLTA